jgi:hypothetical protein
MNERLQKARQEAERGDLRPQFNPHSPIVWPTANGDLAAVAPVLFQRFFQLARPIADASTGPGPDMRLQDAGRFFYLVEALRRVSSDQVEETLLMILDDFRQLEPRCYDELYLWSIVQLSRMHRRHVMTFWPLVLTLDLRYRSAPWSRPRGRSLVDLPYRLCELLFYYYFKYTLQQRRGPNHRRAERQYPTLGSLLEQLAGELSEEQVQLACATLRELSMQDSFLFGDYCGMLIRRRRELGH